MSSDYSNRLIDSGCSTNASEEVKITVPVTVRGIAEVGDVNINCIGSPIITNNSNYTPGTLNSISKFTVGQRIRLDIPILFDAEADIGEGRFEFASSTENNCDTEECN